MSKGESGQGVSVSSSPDISDDTLTLTYEALPISQQQISITAEPNQILINDVVQVTGSATFVINTEAVELNMASFSLSYNGAPIDSSDISLYIDVNGTIKRVDSLSSDVNGLLELDLALLGYNNDISNGAYTIGLSTKVSDSDYYYYVEDGVEIDFDESVFSAYSVDLDKGTTCKVDAIYPPIYLKVCCNYRLF